MEQFENDFQIQKEKEKKKNLPFVQSLLKCMITVQQEVAISCFACGEYKLSLKTEKRRKINVMMSALCGSFLLFIPFCPVCKAKQ